MALGKQEPIRWKNLYIASILLFFASIIAIPFDTRLSIMFLLAVPAIWSNVVPGALTNNYLAALELVDFFGIMIALGYGPLWGASFSLVVGWSAKIFNRVEWPFVSIKAGLTWGMGAIIAYYLFTWGIITHITTLILVMIIWNIISYTFIWTTLIEGRGAIAIELYYDVVNAPITYLHRVTIGLIGGDYLYTLLKTGGASLVPLYLFIALLIALLLGSKKILARIGEAKERMRGVWVRNKEQAMRNLVHRTGFTVHEFWRLAFSGVVLALGVSSAQWYAGESPSFVVFIPTFIIAFVACFFSYTSFIAAKKWYAQRINCYAVYKWYRPVSMFSALVGVAFKGAFILTSLGTVNVKKFQKTPHKPYIRQEDHSRIALAGILISVGLMFVAKIASGFFGDALMFSYLFKINAWIVGINMIPFIFPYTGFSSQTAMYEWRFRQFMPPFDGAKIMYSSPSLWAFTAAWVAFLIPALVFFSPLVALFLAVIFAGLVWTYFEYIFIRRS